MFLDAVPSSALRKSVVATRIHRSHPTSFFLVYQWFASGPFPRLIRRGLIEAFASPTSFSAPSRFCGSPVVVCAHPNRHGPGSTLLGAGADGPRRNARQVPISAPRRRGSFVSGRLRPPFYWVVAPGDGTSPIGTAGGAHPDLRIKRCCVIGRRQAPWGSTRWQRSAGAGK